MQRPFVEIVFVSGADTNFKYIRRSAKKGCVLISLPRDSWIFSCNLNFLCLVIIRNLPNIFPILRTNRRISSFWTVVCGWPWYLKGRRISYCEIPSEDVRYKRLRFSAPYPSGENARMLRCLRKGHRDFRGEWGYPTCFRRKFLLLEGCVDRSHTTFLIRKLHIRRYSLQSKEKRYLRFLR